MSTILRPGVLALIWIAVTGDVTPGNLLLGVLLSVPLVLFAKRTFGTVGFSLRPGRVLSLLVFFIRELIISNLRVAYEVLTPGYRMQPAIIAVPLDVHSDIEITLLANLISLTPGTLSLDVSSDRRTLYIHALYARNGDQVRRAIKTGFEQRIAAMFVIPPRERLVTHPTKGTR